MFIPTFQGLTATDFVLSASGTTTARRYPFDAPHLTFYRARNAIYHLFKALNPANDRLTVLVPDYNSGNEVLAHATPPARPSATTRSDRTGRLTRPKSSACVHSIARTCSTSFTTSDGRSRCGSSRDLCAAPRHAGSSKTARWRC